MREAISLMGGAISLMREALSQMREAISLMRQALSLMREAIGRTFSGVILMRPSTLPEVSDRSSVVSAWGEVWRVRVRFGFGLGSG